MKVALQMGTQPVPHPTRHSVSEGCNSGAELSYGISIMTSSAERRATLWVFASHRRQAALYSSVSNAVRPRFLSAIEKTCDSRSQRCLKSRTVLKTEIDYNRGLPGPESLGDRLSHCHAVLENIGGRIEISRWHPARMLYPESGRAIGNWL